MNRKERRAAGRGAGSDRGQNRAARAASLTAEGAGLHGQGDLAGAERCYREALKQDAAQAQAAHYLGLLAAQSGRLAEAERLIRQALTQRPRDAETLRNLAKVELAAGKVEVAEGSVRAALAERPDDGEAAIVLGAVLAAQGRAVDAETALRQALEQLPGHPEALNHLGGVLLAEGRFAEAAETFQAALSAAPGFGEALINLGETHLAGGEAEQAEKLARQALSGGTHPRLLDLLSRALAARGASSDALEAATAAVAAAPHDLQMHYNLAFTQQETGRWSEAEASYRTMLAKAPDFTAAWANLGALLQKQERLEEAEAALRKALALDPVHREARLNLATGLEQASRLTEAAEELRRLMALAPDHPATRVLAARLDRRAGRIEAAAKRLADAPPPEAPAVLREDWLFERGRNLDRLGRYEEAFAAFAEANALAAQRGAALRGEQDHSRRLIETLQTRFTPEWVGGWSQLVAPERAESPIFLVGFPRSGTTLLHHILAGHSQLAVMEEVEALDAARRFLAEVPDGFPDCLEALGEAEAQAARRVYWQAVDGAVARAPGQRLVDKLPLNLMQLGLAQRLWPEAQVIFALRHPCDVCLSAYMQNFDLNDAMANFLTLKDAGSFYDSVMRLYQTYEQTLALDEMAVRYEDLLEDFEGEVARLLAFLGLEWEEGVRDFTATAHKRGRINTPSYSQVTEGLYTRARYRWEHYRPHLVPLIEQVGPWATTFGYPAV